MTSAFSFFRLSTLPMMLLLAMGCERQFPTDVDGETEGYLLTGSVRDRLGNPVAGAGVRLFYFYDPVDFGPPPTKEFYVSNSAQLITVGVYDRRDRLRRTLYRGTHPVGTMRVEWDKKDSIGGEMPSSVYTVRYIVAGEVQHSYPVVVSETITATSAGDGSFTITDENLPIGFYPVPLSSPDGSTYYGLHRIASTVGLRFVTGAGTSRFFLVTLEKGRVARIGAVLD